MNEQHTSLVDSASPRQPAVAHFGPLRVFKGMREYCTQCGETIFADAIACALNVHMAGKEIQLHFHYRCYLVWEREGAPSFDL